MKSCALFAVAQVTVLRLLLLLTILLCLFSGPSRETRSQWSGWNTRSSWKHLARTGNSELSLPSRLPRALRARWCCHDSYLVLLTPRVGPLGRRECLSVITEQSSALLRKRVFGKDPQLPLSSQYSCKSTLLSIS